MHQLIRIDKYLFSLLNGKWHNEFFDAIMPFLRNASTWIPLYFFLLLFILYNFRKNQWMYIVIAACTVILSNFISSDIIKENIFRLRPCNDPDLADSIRVLVLYRPISSSFTSSHAMNHFAMAAFFYYTMRDHVGKWGYLFFLWATIVIYAQVYVGVHYPLDVISGGLFGFVLGYLSARSFNSNYGLR